MLEMEKPRIECVERYENGSYAKFVVEPLERGYGITIGNSLKRVLLSSLPGSAVTTIKIDGALKASSKIPGVMEDITDIVLNIKSLALKGYTNEPRVIRLESQGAGVVTAGDIICDSDIVVLNKDLKIATLDNAGRLSIEMTVERGYGYVSAEQNKIPDDGVIPIDSIFTPIYKVDYMVEATRVGQITDYDRLTLETWSNGSISPEEATSRAARILNDQLLLFTKLNTAFATGESTEEIKKESKQDRNLKMSIEDLDLSMRAYNGLKRAGINSVKDLTRRAKADMFKVRNLGLKSLEEIDFKLKELGLSFQHEED
ncbi:DNA-directed RNA polymerase, alpha subunit [Desulfosporosinus acidiphilus SJ4]|uniref:DNA-directed RNA polymerase subunit alpha n=1 Tax=Desulfosporosinus acidiphilus (strain DSM 22704 / JCM 16185 / SJ4) TaxID=646529 RepID=I4DB05_DESAJ|nr:DNA-directed RNA polymerase subunit alpha [Desulfosporosinus acidiphilus]AFM42979.1 DNA-directed RNA polymerase, alpha subunit [Desulfosporosinus acidiphilus SJ4]